MVSKAGRWHELDKVSVFDMREKIVQGKDLRLYEKETASKRDIEENTMKKEKSKAKERIMKLN